MNRTILTTLALGFSLVTALAQTNALQLPPIVLNLPQDGKVTVKSLAAGLDKWPGKIGPVRLVGGGKLEFTRDESGLHVLLPEKFDGKIAFALKVRS